MKIKHAFCVPRYIIELVALPPLLFSQENNPASV